ncbi:MAG: bi-domain-containing oxidoreductase [Dissulfurispiraceae bacterium]
MNQLTQKLMDGTMEISEVPVPALLKGHILVRNHYSLISAGTEGSTVQTARKSLIGKAKERPQQVRQVLDTLKTQGPVQTYRAVMKKLDAYSPLGYSCTGEVIEVAADVSGFEPGDLVACGGLSASHAEVVSVPVNLSVKLNNMTDLKQAAYNTLGAIAMQGVRQADLRIGETCAVVGLGLLGQLSSLLLRAAGVRVIGIDIDPVMVEIAGKNCTDLAIHRNTDGIEKAIFEFSRGIGCDAVIITAATNNLDPINFAGAIARKRGTIVIVGSVPTGFNRDPHFYRKELQVRMSCSYGPGRYDPQYEEKGIDYPAAYVRWTEKRNMEAFQELIYSKKIDVSYLTTHTFKLDSATNAYEMMMSRSQFYIGIIIEYYKKSDFSRAKIMLKSGPAVKAPASIGIGFIGAGSYAQSHLLPNIPKDPRISLKGVVTTTGVTAKSVGDRFGFGMCSTSTTDILDNPEINTVFVATRHDSHAGFVVKALKAGKHVFVEKPLCLTEEELQEIKDACSYAKIPSLLVVGYNRRFAPLAEILKREFFMAPMSILYRVNAGAIPAESWIQDMEIGGGRIIGEVCHFVDFLTFLNGSLPVSVYAASMQTADNLNDTLVITLTFENGSVGTISYFANGDKSMPKERIEVFTNGKTAVLDDFRTLSIYASGKKKEKKLITQDKGQKKEIRLFVDAIICGKSELIPFAELYSTSRVTFAILESLRTATSISLSQSVSMLSPSHILQSDPVVN